MTCEIYMVGLPIMPIKASIFRPSLVYECLSLLGECWDNGLSRVCCMDGWHLHLHIGDCINRPRQSGETHNNNSSHFLVNLQHITSHRTVSTSGGNVSRRKNQESSLKPASAKMCVAGGASNGPSRKIEVLQSWRRPLHGVFNVNALVDVFN